MFHKCNNACTWSENWTRNWSDEKGDENFQVNSESPKTPDVLEKLKEGLFLQEYEKKIYQDYKIRSIK